MKGVHMKSQRDIARELAPLLGKKAEHSKTLSVQLNQIILGRRPLPAIWEPHLMKIMECSNREELTKRFPTMRLHAESFITYSLEPLEVEVTVTMSTGVVPEVRIPDVIRALRVLDQFGIKTELRVRRKV